MGSSRAPRAVGRWVVLGLVAGCGATAQLGEGGPGLGDAGRAPDLAGFGRPGDAFPTGAVSFFKTPTCPEGWDSYPQAANRLIVPTTGIAEIGAAVGIPLGNAEDRAHTHAVEGRVELRAVSYAGIAGEANHGVAAAGAVAVSAQTAKASTGLPYVQLRVCKKTAAPRAFGRPLPRGALLFFDAPTCPAGWVQATATQGRFLVGLPDRGAPGASFGGPPLATPDPRAHAHPAPASLATEPHGIALASGCCAGGYAENGMYAVAATAKEAAAALPFVQLLQCQRQ